MEKGAKRVEIAGKDDKTQITAVSTGSMNGDFLPQQIIYQGKQLVAFLKLIFILDSTLPTPPIIRVMKSP